MIAGNRLPESARDALIFLAVELSHGFEGEIRIRCGEGGSVRAIHLHSERRVTADQFRSGHEEAVGIPSGHPDP